MRRGRREGRGRRERKKKKRMVEEEGEAWVGRRWLFLLTQFRASRASTVTRGQLQGVIFQSIHGLAKQHYSSWLFLYKATF